MRNVVTNVDDFCEELTAEAAQVHQGIVRVRVDRTTDESSEEVGLWATTLIRTDDGDYVLEFGGYCGEDRPQNEDPSVQRKGTETADRWREQIAAVCESHELTMRKGKIEVF